VLVDLHLHSTASDGTNAPGEVVRLAAERGMGLIALTDHDSVDGIAEAAAAAGVAGIAMIPGVELGCEGEREVHLLGYGIDPSATAWQGFFDELQCERRERALRVVALLRGMGYAIDDNAVTGVTAPSVTRTHIAQALVAAGAAGSVREAFQRLVGPGCPAYLPRPRLSVASAADRLHAQGAVSVLAHPGLLPMAESDLERRVRAWRDQGLMGIEAYYPRHTPAQTRRFDRLARSLGMLVTGGSDAHGEPIRPTRIGDGLENWRTRDRDAQALWQAVFHRVGEWRAGSAAE
jgi:predicted metal-dependent phosphoesterase TrpH